MALQQRRAGARSHHAGKRPKCSRQGVNVVSFTLLKGIVLGHGSMVWQVK